MITNKSFADLEATMIAEGLIISTGVGARKYTGESGLGEGLYTPVMKDGMPANTQKSRTGREFDALAFKNAKGTVVQVGVRSIISPIMVLDKPTTNKKWDGVEPAHALYRYGALSDIGLPSNQKSSSNGVKSVVVYDAQPFELKKKIQYVVPHFEDYVRDNGSIGQRPRYEAGCEIREVWAVADVEKFPAVGNNTSLPAAQ